MRLGDDLPGNNSCIIRRHAHPGCPSITLYAREHQIDAGVLQGWSNLRGLWEHFTLELPATSRAPEYACSDTWSWDACDTGHAQLKKGDCHMTARKAVSYNPYDYVVMEQTAPMEEYLDSDIELLVPTDDSRLNSILAKVESKHRERLCRALGAGFGLAIYDKSTKERTIFPALDGAAPTLGEGALLPIIFPSCTIGRFATFADTRANAISVSTPFNTVRHIRVLVWRDDDARAGTPPSPVRAAFSGVTSLTHVSHASVYWNACVPDVSRQLNATAVRHDWSLTGVTAVVRYVALVIAHFWRVFIEASALPEPHEMAATAMALQRRGWDVAQGEEQIVRRSTFTRDGDGNWELGRMPLFTRLRLMPMRVVQHTDWTEVMATGATVPVSASDGFVTVKIVARLAMDTGVLELCEQDGSTSTIEFQVRPPENAFCYVYFLLPIMSGGEEPRATCPSLRCDADDDECRAVSRLNPHIKQDASTAPGVQRMFIHNAVWQAQSQSGWQRLSECPSIRGLVLNINMQYPKDAVLVLSLERAWGHNASDVSRGIDWQLSTGLETPKWLHVLTEDHALRVLADFYTTPFTVTNEMPHLAHLMDEPIYPGFNIAFARSNWREAARAKSRDGRELAGRWTPIALCTSRMEARRKAVAPSWLGQLGNNDDKCNVRPGSNMSIYACLIIDEARRFLFNPLQRGLRTRITK